MESNRSSILYPDTCDECAKYGVGPCPHVSTTYSIEPLRIIEFDERPALDHATASEQLEHLYIHMGLVQEKVNECVSMLNAVIRGLGVER